MSKSPLTAWPLWKPTSRQEKCCFVQAALKHVTILQCIDSVLKAKSTTIPDEFFHDILDEHFSQDEVKRQFETAMNWGRYAEIFDHDPENERLIWTDPSPKPIIPQQRQRSKAHKRPVSTVTACCRFCHAVNVSIPDLICSAPGFRSSMAYCWLHARGLVHLRHKLKSRAAAGRFPFMPDIRLLRISAAYFLSLIFTLVYGYIAAYNPRAERFMIPLLDVLQSIPVLSFLPGVMLAMVALFPSSPIGSRTRSDPADFHRPSLEHGF